MVNESRPEVLAIVLARSGSKSLPAKNIRQLAGHPLIAYSIAAGAAARTVTRLIVSTDSQEIGDIARRYGADVPFIRPVELAQDDTPDLPVFEHALRWLQDAHGYSPDVIVQLRPTSPFRPEGFVDQGVERLLARPDAHSVRSIAQPNQNPYKMWREDADGWLHPLLDTELDEPFNLPRQRLPPVCWQTGHLDVFRHSVVIERRSLTGARVLPLAIERDYCVDIDSEADWRHAESLMAGRALRIVLPGLNGAAISPVIEARLAAIELLVLDFDGVLTDNRVWTDQEGRESVACSRSDGMGIGLLGARGVPAVVLSKEANPVVAARCAKLGVRCQQGVDQKGPAFEALVREHGLSMAKVAYVGNDVNDLECLQLAGVAAVVADAHDATRPAADIVLRHRGGHGAVRELCDAILLAKEKARDL